MHLKLCSRAKTLICLLIVAAGTLIPLPAMGADSPSVSPSPGPTETARPSHTTLPPYDGDVAPVRVRTRTDRLISTIAPIAMVLVLVAGLYIYWLIRKGL